MTDSVSSFRFGRIAAMLPVTDMARACDFYVGALGFRKTFENGNPVGFMILKRDAAELHLTLQPGHKAADFNVAHMMVEDIDADLVADFLVHTETTRGNSARSRRNHCSGTQAFRRVFRRWVIGKAR